MDMNILKVSSRSPSMRVTDYSRYKGRDFSALSPREREVIMLKIDGLTYQQIANNLGIQTGCVGVLLQKARQKLDGTYRDGLRLVINQRVKDSMARNPVRNKETKKKTYLKNRDKIIAKMKEYNKQYYQKHRDEILKKQKEKWTAKKKEDLG